MDVCIDMCKDTCVGMRVDMPQVERFRWIQLCFRCRLWAITRDEGKDLRHAQLAAVVEYGMFDGMLHAMMYRCCTVCFMLDVTRATSSSMLILAGECLEQFHSVHQVERVGIVRLCIYATSRAPAYMSHPMHHIIQHII